MKVAMPCAAVVMVVVIVAAVMPAVRGAGHTVGGPAGWSQSFDYKSWASGETFVVGDTLQFSYRPTHSVDQVSESNYDSCSSGSPIQSYRGGSTTINLTSVGPMYFICPTVGHCAGGMKLAITVQSSSISPSTSPSSPLTLPSTTTTPSSPPSTPATTPNTNNSPPPPSTTYNGVGTDDSLNIVLAAVSFVLSTLVLGGGCY